MVPVKWIMRGTLRVTLTATSSAMLLPRGNLKSQSRGVLQLTTCSAPRV